MRPPVSKLGIPLQPVQYGNDWPDRSPNMQKSPNNLNYTNATNNPAGNWSSNNETGDVRWPNNTSRLNINSPPAQWHDNHNNNINQWIPPTEAIPNWKEPSKWAEAPIWRAPPQAKWNDVFQSTRGNESEFQPKRIVPNENAFQPHRIIPTESGFQQPNKVVSSENAFQPNRLGSTNYQPEFLHNTRDMLKLQGEDEFTHIQEDIKRSELVDPSQQLRPPGLTPGNQALRGNI